MVIVSQTHGVVLSALDAFLQAGELASGDKALSNGMPPH